MGSEEYVNTWREFIRKAGFTVRPEDTAMWQVLVNSQDADFQAVLAWLPRILKNYGAAAAEIQPMINRETTFLDFGGNCGLIGWHLYDKVAEYHLMDISPEALGIARDIVLREQPNCFFHLSNGQDLSNLKAEYYNFIYAKAVLQHLPRPLVLTYIDEFIRVLRPGGITYFTNVFENLGEKVSVDSEVVSWHVREIPMSELYQILDQAGFELKTINMHCDIRPGGSMNGWVKAIKRSG